MRCGLARRAGRRGTEARRSATRKLPAKRCGAPKSLGIGSRRQSNAPHAAPKPMGIASAVKKDEFCGTLTEYFASRKQGS